ncbi:hypothetical protein [Salipaludibacillus daqingensis]|uniref:hypothetical protein n=1 Tax=Salipaludibacillus daqingensis TaxID=3041001 RepID=UPI0024764D58|nr:hypothetical protein [Salipaludibacillus daqingensis]
MKLFLLIILALLPLVGCSEDFLFQNKSPSNTVLPITTDIYQTPLAMSYHANDRTDKGVYLSFIVEHTDESPIASDDYQFQWPKYVADDRDIVYEVKDVEYTHSEIDNKTLENHQLGIKLKITPPPPKGSVDQLIQIPLYIVPRLFEQGYPFPIDEEVIDQIEVGDLILEDVQVKENTVSFNLLDQHPDGNHRHLAYLFSRLQEGQNIYPMFSRMEKIDNHLHVQLEFAQDITLPGRFSIDRTTVDLPEWRFSFVLPLNEDNLE